MRSLFFKILQDFFFAGMHGPAVAPERLANTTCCCTHECLSTTRPSSIFTENNKTAVRICLTQNNCRIDRRFFARSIFSCFALFSQKRYDFFSATTPQLEKQQTSIIPVNAGLK